MHKQLLLVIFLAITIKSANVLAIVAERSPTPDFYVPFTIATFTHVPFGEHFTDQLLILDNNLCENSQVPFFNRMPPFVLMVKRGGCAFTVKALTAKQLGARVLIIYDNLNSTSPVIMRMEAPLTMHIEMPVLAITQEAGQKIIDLAAVNPIVIVEIHFGTVQTDRPQLQLFVRQFKFTYDYVSSLNASVSSIKTAFDTLAPVYKILGMCLDCDSGDCLTSSMKWCMQTHKEQLMKGKQFVEESLRQSFIVEKSQDGWWAYMDQFKDNCFGTSTSNCIPALMMEAGGLSKPDIEWVIQQTQIQLEKAMNDNVSRVQSWLETAQNESIMDSFAIQINGVQYAGVGIFHPDSVVKMLCASFIAPPSECTNKLTNTVAPRTVNTTDIKLKSVGLVNIKLYSELHNFK